MRDPSTPPPTLESLMEENLPKRANVLASMVQLEFLTAQTLKLLLDIGPESTSFEGREALGFNQKMNLLLDMKVIPDPYPSRFRFLRDIRNLFAHNMEAYNYTHALKWAEKKPEKLFAWYDPEPTLDLEGRLEKAFDAMFKDMVRVSDEIFKEARDRSWTKSSDKWNAQGFENVLRNKSGALRKYLFAADDRAVAGGTFTTEEVKEMIRDIDLQLLGFRTEAVSKQERERLARTPVVEISAERAKAEEAKKKA